MPKRVISLTVLLIWFTSFNFSERFVLADNSNQPVLQVSEASWPMAAANPERTSWTPEEVRGSLKPVWFKPFEPYISQKVQIIAANDTLYISTVKGLYALDATTGAERWVYPTEFPLGHSPTIDNSVAYVGGLDRKLHAVNALTGNRIWTFEAEGGFQTNPLVVEGRVYAGNRDGFFYAVYTEGPNTGKLAWKYQTEGPILYSAAYKDGLVFFASTDMHAYALNAQTGTLVWKSTKLPGASFHSWWPVVYRDRVLFSGSMNYRNDGPGARNQVDDDDAFPNRATDPRGTLVGPQGVVAGDWAAGTPTIDATRVMKYLQQKPWRQTYFVLDRLTGGQRETAPILWAGTAGGNRYPPIIGVDGVVYQQNVYLSDPWIPGGQVSGWKIGTPYISITSVDWGARDEPHAYSGGGRLIYWNLCCDRQTGAFDITIPLNRNLGYPAENREWVYYNYDLDIVAPGYNIRWYLDSGHGTFDSPNGIYGNHGSVNPPIPYKGKVYMHRSNAIIAFGNQTGAPVVLPMARTVVTVETNIPARGQNYLKAQLEQEIRKILNAGHLKPGYINHGGFVNNGGAICGDNLADYWHNTSETIYTLIQALPYLPLDMQQQVKSYLQSEFTTYPPYQYDHIGWRNGAAREAFDLPQEVMEDFVNFPPTDMNYTFKNSGGWLHTGVWGRNPYSFYALWKYAKLLGNAQTIFQVSKDKLESPPVNQVLLSMPHVHNAFIAGYLGYLELEKLAGQPESSNIRSELNRLLQLRANNFTKDSAYRNAITPQEQVYCRTLNVSNNFMFLVPELATYLRDNARKKVQQALEEYYRIAPYWFVSLAQEGFLENAINPLYDSHAIFMAKALILQESSEELEKYLDVPAFARGDLYYIQKLIAILDQSGFALNVTNPMQAIRSGEVATYHLQIQHISGFTQPITLTTIPPTTELGIQLNPTVITSPGGSAILTLTDFHNPSFTSTIWSTIPITGSSPGIQPKTTQVYLLVNGFQTYLPFTTKSN